MSADLSANFPLLVSRNAAREAIGNALRLYIGRGRRYTVKEVQRATGVKDRLIEAAMYPPEHVECRGLKSCELLSLCLFFGPEFTSDVIKPAHQAAFALPDGDDGTALAIIAAENSADNAAIAQAVVHDEGEDRERLHGVGLRLVARGHELVARKRAA